MSFGLTFSFIAPVLLLVAAAFAFANPGKRPAKIPALSEWISVISLAAAALSLLHVIIIGPVALGVTQGMFAFALRTDLIPATLTLLVGFVGWIVMRYSRTYLDGEAREGRFHGLMLATLAATYIFAQAGSVIVLALAAIAIGIGLRRLLLFYPERAEARRAATKFSIVWYAADAALVIAAIMLTAIYATGDLAALSVVGQNNALGIAGHLAIAFIVLAAALKTACFPLHGWLTEVMEAPTPVSALLHAGIINAGGVLLIKLSMLVALSPGAMAALVMIGGFTALFGAAVMLTQSAVKTSLAWSTVSQMGFMLLQCGLGLWALALLHIIAHSLYKAHAFLSSGGAVQAVAALRKPGHVAVPDVAAVLKSFGISLLLYGSIATLFTLVIGPKSAQALALGAILIFGVAYLVAQGLADQAPKDLTKRTGLAALGAGLAYFTLQEIALALFGPALPSVPVAGALEWALIVLAVFSFGLVAFAQTLFPLWAHHPATIGLRVHLANGFYLNALLDRMIGGFRTAKT